MNVSYILNRMDCHPNYANTHLTKCKKGWGVSVVINKMTIDNIIPSWINNESMKNNDSSVY